MILGMMCYSFENIRQFAALRQRKLGTQTTAKLVSTRKLFKGKSTTTEQLTVFWIFQISAAICRNSAV
jgi:hypothetical protein